MSLIEHDGSFVISLDGAEIMHSRASTSEELLGELGVEGLNTDTASRVLIGGLGLGFTLKTALEFGMSGLTKMVTLGQCMGNNGVLGKELTAE